MAEKSVLEIIKEYINEASDLLYMEDAVKNSYESTEVISEYTNSDIPSCKRRMDNLKKELLKQPVILLVKYRDSSNEEYEMLDHEIDNNNRLLRNDNLLPQDRKRLEEVQKKLESERSAAEIEVTILEEALFTLGYEEPKEENDIDDDSVDPGSQGFGSKSFHN
ncbi:MAG: hypothetical protein IKZ96_01600 [Bacilli bacterium]|nr:hypothetical protein [Bacilli bacterium]